LIGEYIVCKNPQKYQLNDAKRQNIGCFEGHKSDPVPQAKWFY
jgi:hypothetical protein